MRYQQRGMTLLEIVISASIFALVISLCFSVSIFSARSFNESISFSYLQTKGERALKVMTEAVGDAHALDPDTVTEDGDVFYGAQIGYTLPVNYGKPTSTSHQLINPNGLPVFREDITTPTLTGDFSLVIEPGWRDERYSVLDLVTNSVVPLQGPGLKTTGAPAEVSLLNGLTPKGQMAFRFVKNRNAELGINGVYSESVHGVDIDNDGALTSRYAVGYLERCIYLDNDHNGVPETLMESSRMALADSNVLLPIGGTASGDPDVLKTTRLFTLSPSKSRIDITIWLVSVGELKTPRVVKCTTSVFLRNHQ